MKRKKTGFTLVELLIVMAIIGILIAISFPVLNKVKESARTTAARLDMQSIITAVEQYKAEYRRMPIPDIFHVYDGRRHTWRGLTEKSTPERLDLPGGGWHHRSTAYTANDSGELAKVTIATLQGSNEYKRQETGFNPRREVFLERQEGRPVGIFMDPWSKGYDLTADPGNRQYQLLMDHNMNGIIEVAAVYRTLRALGVNIGVKKTYVNNKTIVSRCSGVNRIIEPLLDDDLMKNNTNPKWDSKEFDDIYSFDIIAFLESLKH